MDGTPKKISTRVFDPTCIAFDAVVVAHAETLDALAAELKTSADKRTTIEAMTLDTNDFFFLAAVFMLPIVAQIDSRCSGYRRALAANAAAPLAAPGRERCPAAKAAKRRRRGPVGAHLGAN